MPICLPRCKSRRLPDLYISLVWFLEETWQMPSFVEVCFHAKALFLYPVMRPVREPLWPYHVSSIVFECGTAWEILGRITGRQQSQNRLVFLLLVALDCSIYCCSLRLISRENFARQQKQTNPNPLASTAEAHTCLPVFERLIVGTHIFIPPFITGIAIRAQPVL